MSDEEYESMTGILDLAEDVTLGFIAEKRLKNSRESDYIDIESLCRKLGTAPKD